VNPGATAQDAYRQMLREHIAPALRELGFRRGPSLGAFRYETTTHAAEVRFIKSRLSTRQEVSFWVKLHASDIRTERVYWRRTLASLDPEPRVQWDIEAGGPIQTVASDVLRAFRSYGWPAIQAALDNPGYPKDPAARWPRTFPKIPRGPLFDDEIEAAQRSWAELVEIMDRADSDPLAFRALLTRLESDPDPAIRQGAAWFLLHRVHDEPSRQALRAAAAEDEDVEVRWIARYAFRLAQRQTPPEAAGTATQS
jgi:hypothetical protein